MDGQDQSLRLLELPSETLIIVLQKLNPNELRSAELICKRFRYLVVGDELWRKRCEAALPGSTNIAPANVNSLPAEKVAVSGTREEKQSAFFKKYLTRVTAPTAHESLIRVSLGASSTDQPNVEDLRHVLKPVVRSMHGQYWSSKGSDDVDSSEVICFALGHRFCIVNQISLRPYSAWFQAPPGTEAPIYAPQAVRFTIGGLPCFMPNGSPTDLRQLSQATKELLETYKSAVLTKPGQENVWVSEVYPFKKEDTLQTFTFPPVLCTDGFLQIELIGRTQRQEADQRYYTCLGYVKALGTPVYNFAVQSMGSEMRLEILHTGINPSKNLFTRKSEYAELVEAAASAPPSRIHMNPPLHVSPSSFWRPQHPEWDTWQACLDYAGRGKYVDLMRLVDRMNTVRSRESGHPMYQIHPDFSVRPVAQQERQQGGTAAELKRQLDAGLEVGQGNIDAMIQKSWDVDEDKASNWVLRFVESDFVKETGLRQVCENGRLRNLAPGESNSDSESEGWAG